RAPVAGLGEVTWSRRSTAARSATGWLNQTPTGRPTPTVSPSRGMIAARSSARGARGVEGSGGRGRGAGFVGAHGHHPVAGRRGQGPGTHPAAAAVLQAAGQPPA